MADKKKETDKEFYARHKKLLMERTKREGGKPVTDKGWDSLMFGKFKANKDKAGYKPGEGIGDRAYREAHEMHDKKVALAKKRKKEQIGSSYEADVKKSKVMPLKSMLALKAKSRKALALREEEDKLAPRMKKKIARLKAKHKAMAGYKDKKKKGER